MLLILSNETDSITGNIMDSLFFEYGQESVLLNELSLNSPSQLKIEINNNDGVSIKIDHEDISFIFKRKFPIIKIPVSKYHQLAKFYENELKAILSFLDLIGLQESFGIGSINFNPSDVNKLYVLKLAVEAGLLIPSTAIVNNKFDFFQFIEKIDSTCITKPIQNIAAFYDKKSESYSKMLTARIHKKEKIGSVFFPTLLQKEIIKKWELRIFFINNVYYSIAILSQKNEKTQLDFRNYDNVHPNRIMIYDLPNHIKEKLSYLMEKLNLTSGSIDMIYSTSNEYIFLEVNPSGLLGQFTKSGIDLAYIIANQINKKLSCSRKMSVH